MSAEKIGVEVVYAMPDRQALRRLSLSEGSTVMDAIEASRITRDFPEIDLAPKHIGIHGRIAQPDTVLRDGDRVEIYRPLKADPKELRRKRARRSDKGGKAV